MTLGSRFDLNLLRVFDAIYSRASVTHAARHLNLSQSAISHALGRLREHFKDPIFVRAGGGVAPTAFARSIIDPVRTALRGLDVALDSTCQFDPATSTRVFRIAMRPTTETLYFHRIASRILMEAPNVRLSCADFRRTSLTSAFVRGDLDFLLDIENNGISSLRSIRLRKDKLVVACRKNHPVMNGTSALDDYLAADHVIASPRQTGGSAEDVKLATMGYERRISVRCQSVVTAWEIVASSDFLLTLPISQAETLARSSAVDVVPLPFEVRPLPLCLYWHGVSDGDAGNIWMRSIIQNVAASDEIGLHPGAAVSLETALDE